LVSGLASGGMHIFTLGPLPTNGLAMLTKSMKANMGIMITASHNPYYDNGLKLFGPDGMKLSDQIEKKIEEFISAGIEWLPINKISLDKEKTKSLISFLETLEQDDDVQHVYANLSIDNNFTEKTST